MSNTTVKVGGSSDQPWSSTGELEIRRGENGTELLKPHPATTTSNGTPVPHHQLKEPMMMEEELLCRLCAQEWMSVGQDEEGGMAWMGLSKNYLESTETVLAVVGKYIPSTFLANLSVLNKCLEKCLQNICVTCFVSLQSTKTFFDKVTLGQEELKKRSNLLGGIIVPLNDSKRKRGRPRKDDSAKVEKPNVEVMISVEEPRVKRSCRVPVKYGTDFSVNVPDAKQASHSSDNVSMSNHNSKALLLDQTEEQSNKVSGGSNLEKLNTDSSKIDDKQNPTSISQTDDGGTLAAIKAENSDEGDAQQSDSDVSIKLSDLVRGRKPGKRRTRGRPKVRRPKRKEFRCTACEKVYTTQSSLMYHRLSAHENTRKFQCTECSKSFTHRGLLANHVFTHSEKTFPCDEPECNSTFKSRSSLYTHKRSLHATNGAKEFTCERCGLQFAVKSTLQAHIRLHTGEKPFSCQFCEKRFNHRGNLKEHIRTHTKEKPYVCSLGTCGKRFATSSQLRTHKSIHSESKEFLCTECGIGFASSDNWKHHMKFHSGEKLLECSYCPKQFADSLALKKHQRKHTGEKPYECLVCNKSFSDASNFAKHKKIHKPTSSSSPAGSEDLKSGPEQSCTTDVQPDSRSESIDLSPNEEIVVTETCVPRSPERTEISGSEISGSVLGTEGDTLVQILPPENFAAVDNGVSCTSASDTQILYIYPANEIFAIASEEHQTIEVAANETVTLSEDIGNLSSSITFESETQDLSNGSKNLS